VSVSKLRFRGATREVRIEKQVAEIDGRRVEFRVRRTEDGRPVGIEIGGRQHPIAVARDGDRVWVWCDGETEVFERVTLERPTGARRAATREHGGDLLSPMPGRVRRTVARDGERVAQGQVILVLEAMKMEHSIRAPREGSIRLRVREGDLVEAGVELAEVVESHN